MTTENEILEPVIEQESKALQEIISEYNASGTFRNLSDVEILQYIEWREGFAYNRGVSDGKSEEKMAEIQRKKQETYDALRNVDLMLKSIESDFAEMIGGDGVGQTGRKESQIAKEE